MSCNCCEPYCYDCYPARVTTTSTTTTTTLCPDAIECDSVYLCKCIEYTGSDWDCFGIHNGDGLCDVIEVIFNIISTTTTTPPALRCVYNFAQYPYPATPPMMEDFNFNQATDYDEFELLDFTVNGVQYASGQTLTVNQTTNPPVYGVGQDGLTYPMNVSDWINSIGVPGITFYDNMRVVDLISTTTYSIHIQKQWPPGQIAQYYFTSGLGFGVNTQSSTYGTQDCFPYAP